MNLCLLYGKRYFQEHKWSAFLSMAQITQILLFSGAPLLKRSIIIVRERHLFKKHICRGSFRYVSTLREKVYSRAPVRCFAFFFIAQITQILLFSGIAPLERSKIIVWEWHILKKEIFYEIFRQMPTLRKKVFSRAPVKCFSIYGSDSVVLGMLLLENSKITVWYRHLFKKNCFWSFSCLCTLRKKVFSRVPVKCFSLYSSNTSDSVVFGNADFSEIKDRSWRTIDF